MDAFLAQLLDKRVQLIDEAVTRGKLPIAVKYVLKRAEYDLGNESKRQADLAAIDDVSTKLAKLDSGSKQLPRALLAEVHARTAAVQLAKASAKLQIPKAEAALKRADLIVKKNSGDAGVTPVDLLDAEEELKKVNNSKK